MVTGRLHLRVGCTILSLSTPSAGVFAGARASLPNRDSDLKCLTTFALPVMT